MNQNLPLEIELAPRRPWRNGPTRIEGSIIQDLEKLQAAAVWVAAENRFARTTAMAAKERARWAT